MTDNNHPITPPLDLVQIWVNDAIGPDYEQRIATQAARWGADMELEACREEIIDGAGRLYVDDSKLRVCLADDIWTARRPKPSSLKEQALTLLDDASDRLDAVHENIIRRALESLPS